MIGKASQYVWDRIVSAVFFFILTRIFGKALMELHLSLQSTIIQCIYYNYGQVQMCHC